MAASADEVDVQIKYDGLDVAPTLNVSTIERRRSYQAGEPVEFLATTSYPASIAKADIRITETSGPSRQLADVLAVRPNDVVAWVMPDAGEGEYEYVLRVCDRDGRFDETVPLTLVRSPSADTADYDVLAGIYRHVGENFKVGGGYNFGRFSDDLTDLVQDDQGVFFNLVGKF